MINLKKFFNKFSIYFIFIAIILISAIFLSLLNILGISKSITNILSVIIMMIIFLIMGFLKGKNSISKGYLQGMKIGGILLLILFIIGMITFEFSFKSIIYYLILMLSSIFGSMIGINKKK